MPEHDAPMPTEGELAILHVLWQRGPRTVREVHTELARSQGTGYTTTLKLMQIMAEKGLLLRDERQRAHVYRPARPQEQTLRRIAGDLMQRAFGGSPEMLVMHALKAREVSAEELSGIRKMLDELEGHR